MKKYLINLIESKKLDNIQKNTRVVFGPPLINYSTNEAIVLCLVKNGETWIKDFIEHYQKKGFKHIVFLDNRSKDETLEIAKDYENITILQTDVPFKNNNILLRRYLVERFAKNRWSLTVDIDELWDYPHSDKISLEQFLSYIKKSGANVVVAQMLDMFMEKIPNEKHSLSDYNYYDVSQIRKDDFNENGKFAPNDFELVGLFKKIIKLFRGGIINRIFSVNFYYKEILNDDIKIFRGGIRSTIFGLDRVWLTKMPLLFYDDSIEPIAHQHFSNNAIIADTSTVLLHYKFTHDFKENIQQAVKNKQYASNSE